MTVDHVGVKFVEVPSLDRKLFKVAEIRSTLTVIGCTIILANGVGRPPIIGNRIGVLSAP